MRNTSRFLLLLPLFVAAPTVLAQPAKTDKFALTVVEKSSDDKQAPPVPLKPEAPQGPIGVPP